MGQGALIVCRKKLVSWGKICLQKDGTELFMEGVVIVGKGSSLFRGKSIKVSWEEWG